MSLRVEPCSISEARRFVGEHHRHNRPPLGGLFAAKVTNAGQAVGVGIAGRPVARALDDGHTVELVRVCTTGERNACSMLYGALCRAAKALGYFKAITYTLASEPGASLRASGFDRVAELAPSRGWHQPSRPRYTTDLFGEEIAPLGPKVRWERVLGMAS